MTTLTTNEALSGIFGSISLASWIIVLVPQLAQNYLSSSADSISLAFLCIWFLGDVANLSGSLWAGLVPTVTALAVYFCVADAVLISQCVYYRVQGRRRRRREREGVGADGVMAAEETRANRAVGAEAAEEETEEEPLLSRRTSAASNLGLPGSQQHRRRRNTGSSSFGSYHTLPPRRDSLLAKILEDPSSPSSSPSSPTFLRSPILRNTASVLAICVLGTVGWGVAYKTGVWTPAPLVGDGEGKETPLGAEALGYLSAVAYLGARIPQIVKNWRDGSCEGLSLLFFLLSLLGNMTYGAGILFHSTDRDYVITNLPWLIGSLGTMAEDMVIFVQFHIYGDRSAAAAATTTTVADRDRDDADVAVV